MNVLFIYTAKDEREQKLPLYENMQFGISYISSWLKAHGHQTRLLYLNGYYRPGAIDKCIEEFRPGLVCFTAVYSEYPFVASVAALIKERHPGLFLLAGGPHVTLNPEACLADCFDALCVGEGEEPTLELAGELAADRPPAGIRNLWIRHGDGVERNPSRSFMADLDAYPFPDREMWREWIEDADSRQVVFIGRGCPFPCTYCSNHALRRVSEGTYVRYRQPERIVAEIAEIRTQFPNLREIYLEVESFSVDLPWAQAVCGALEEFNRNLAQPLSFGVNLRLTPKNSFDELFPALQRSNFRFINIGLESGSERVRREILKRSYANEDVVRAVKTAKSYGLRVNLYVLIGVPGETLEDFRETVRVLREAQPDYCGDSIFYPYPGTELFQRAKDMGVLRSGTDLNMERRRATLDLPGFSRSGIMRCYLLFDHYIYKGIRPWYQIYPRIINKTLKAYPLLNALSDNLLFVWLRRTLRGILRPSNQ